MESKGLIDTADFTHEEGNLRAFAEQIIDEDDLRWDLANGGLENLVAVARACAIDANPDNIRQVLVEVYRLSR